MIRVNLYHVLPSDTWAFAYRVPDHPKVIGLVAGLKTREHAEWSVDYVGRELGAQIEYVA